MYKSKKNIGLFCFSGTGSSYFMALLLKEQLIDKGFSVELFRIEHLLMNKVITDLKIYDMIGIVAPIHGGSAPRPVKKFVESLPRNKSKVFIIRTAAGSGWFNQSASVGLIHQLRKKWYDVTYDRILVTSSNCLLDMEEELIKKLYDIARDKKIPHIVEQLEKGVKRRYSRNFLRDVIVVSLHFLEEQVVGRIFGKSLKANDSCTNCGLCEATCPMSNISFKTGKFESGWNCILCMKCVYTCPENSIHSRGLDILQFKNGYDYERIIQKKYLRKKFRMSHKMWRYTRDLHR